MSKYAVVNENNIADNVIIWDGETDYQPEEGYSLVNVDDSYMGIGWELVDGEWISPSTGEDLVIEEAGE
jgi:hypothetical protein